MLKIDKEKNNQIRNYLDDLIYDAVEYNPFTGQFVKRGRLITWESYFSFE